ncbi:metal ABC transporter substrate-binding protein [Neobacillus rhizophilus]|uniref:Zinc ABC transporter substrate-binding protein n=1 Tax=Neobacillus rhizophilus TaxID=2833579 RepID=A0A942U7W8_9BACI|nr:metal ABC transporter substrate-binding protein [Neobacillus rhizophilus]MBS4213918.1 zinc ABC transporter substrate-binding protein [Neobacillus rhizophilus]MBU8917678.1 metal ABC transporter substrate-binding protein [Bacillus sp. FJAT-29953]
MKRLIGLVIILLLMVSGCSKAASTKSEKQSDGAKKLKIVTTFYPIYYFAQKVAGNSANVELLIPNGVEPHDWDPTTKDMMKIQDADVFIYNSHYFETWTEKVLKSIDASKLKVVEASDGIELMDALEAGEEADHDHSEHSSSKDPHVWLSPVLAQQEVDTIAKALGEVDPNNKDQYEKNAADLNSQLAKLDREFKENIDQAKNKEFVTQHAAFGYLAKQYGLTQIPIAGLSPDVEPTLGKLAELTDLTKKKNIKIIYFEELTSSKVADTLAKEIGAETAVLNPLEGLTKEEQKQGLDYIGVMKKNLETLKLSIK